MTRATRRMSRGTTCVPFRSSSFGFNWSFVTRVSSFFQHSLNVLGENIELEIHRIAHLDLVQISMRFRVRDNPHDEAFRKNFGDGKTDSIHRNRSLARDKMGERLWQLDFQSKIFAAFLIGDDG